MDEQEYLKIRVDNQIEWYNRKSQVNQKLYKLLSVIKIIIAALIPLLAGYVDRCKFLQIIVGLFGMIIAAIEGICKLYGFNENWIQYRATCEKLRHEKYFYITKTSPYNQDKSFNILVKRIETIISKENINWSELNYASTETKS